MPDILHTRGIEIYQQTLSEEEYVACLKDKLLEEVREALEAKTKIEICEELSDILEVIEARNSAKRDILAASVRVMN